MKAMLKTITKKWESMSNLNYESAVDKVVNFWTEKTFKTVDNQDNGDESTAGVFGFILSNVLSGKLISSVSDKQIEVYKKSLKENLMAIPEERRKRNIEIFNDYGCDEILTKAHEASGTHTRCSPIKTVSIILPDCSVSARFTYDGKWETL